MIAWESVEEASDRRAAFGGLFELEHVTGVGDGLALEVLDVIEPGREVLDEGVLPTEDEGWRLDLASEDSDRSVEEDEGLLVAMAVIGFEAPAVAVVGSADAGEAPGLQSWLGDTRMFFAEAGEGLVGRCVGLLGALGLELGEGPVSKALREVLGAGWEREWVEEDESGGGFGEGGEPGEGEDRADGVADDDEPLGCEAEARLMDVEDVRGEVVSAEGEKLRVTVAASIEERELVLGGE